MNSCQGFSTLHPLVGYTYLDGAKAKVRREGLSVYGMILLHCFLRWLESGLNFSWLYGDICALFLGDEKLFHYDKTSLTDGLPVFGISATLTQIDILPHFLSTYFEYSFISYYFF